jgi:GntR family transcriptional regulator
LERVFIPCSRCPALEEWDLEKSSIYDLLTDVYHIEPDCSSQTVEAVAAADTVAKQLRVDDGFPLLMLSRIVFEKKAQLPIVFSQDFLRSDYARIHTDAQLPEHNEKIQEDNAGKEELVGNKA